MYEEEWENFPQEVIDAYVLSFMNKCARCKANKGGSTLK